MAMGFSGLGAVAAAEGLHRRAARLFAACARLLAAIGSVLDAPDLLVQHRGLAAARAGLSDECFASLWAEGQALALDEAIRYALEQERTGL